MNIQHYDTVTISESFVVALEYGDYTGLEEIEVEQLEKFLTETVRPNTIYSYSSETIIDRCDVTKLVSNCIEIELYANQD